MKQKREDNTEYSNRLLSQTYKDAKSIATPSHPKKLYIECLKNSSYWHHYSASTGFDIDEMAMLACKNIGCSINYCGLMKVQYENEWEGSSDCT